MGENGGGGTVGETRDRAREVAHGVQDRLDEVRGYAGDAGEWVRELARERPMTAIALAVGVGFVIGRLLSRT